ncbi:unannotated protein [freshwater metagenome]|uniref:Unannotated protein n=1 Tax=freshwater metagenome TaxID=449393 RepID=A0A6J7FIT7_9ZZZZ|nr:hypothetical protein [Actinomycetota bacterium]
MVSVAAAASSASAGSELPLRVEQIRPAVAALEAKLGGAQQYLEVNATPTLVNLFVATDNATHAVAYVYAQGTLSEPAAPEVVKAGAPTFGAADIAFDAARVLAPLLVQLPNSQYRVFSVVGVAGGGVSYLVTVGSAQGGQLEVPVGADGSITGAVQN